MTQGIYKITNNANNKMYIGSSDNIERRLKEHKEQLVNNTHVNYKLQLDFNKYKNQNVFTYKIIEVVKHKEDLLEREGYYINYFHSVANGYNIKNVLESKENIKDQLNTISKEYFKNISKYIVPIKIPFLILKDLNDSQVKRTLRYFRFLNTLHNVLDNYLYLKLKDKIIEGTLKAEIEGNNKWRIDNVHVYIQYTLIERNWRQTILFNMNDLYKYMESKNITLEESLIKYINNKKYLNDW